MRSRRQNPSDADARQLARVRREARQHERRLSFAAVAFAVTSISVGAPLAWVGQWLDERFPGRRRRFFGRKNENTFTAIGAMLGLAAGVFAHRRLTGQKGLSDEQSEDASRD